MNQFIQRNSDEKFARRILTLPRIEHPKERINEQLRNSLDIRGQSTSGEKSNGELIRNDFSNFNKIYSKSSSRLSQRRRSSISSSLTNSTSRSSPSRLSSSQSKNVRLPIFGEGKHFNDQFINELKEILKEKVQKQINEIRRKFLQLSNGNSTGKISQQALQHLIASILIHQQEQIQSEHISRLIQILHLQNHQQISFDQFFHSLLKDENLSHDPMSADSAILSNRTASQMFLILKEKLRTKNDQLLNFIPSLKNPEEFSSKLYKNQFQRILFQMGFQMKTNQFDKLWNKFDPDGFHVIDLSQFVHCLMSNSSLENLSNSFLQRRSETQDQQSAINQHQFPSNSSVNDETPSLPNRSSFDQRQIEIWLLHHYPQGFSHLEKELRQADEQQNGFLSSKEFLRLMRKYSFQFNDENDLDQFLNSLNLNGEKSKNFVPYEKVLQAMKEKILSKEKKKEILTNLSREEEDENENEISFLGQIEYLISKNFKSIENQLKQLDQEQKRFLSSKQWKSFLEDLLEFSLSPIEFGKLKKSFPLDSNGNILYAQYLKKISQKTFDQINFNEEKISGTKIPQWDYMTSKHIRERLQTEHENCDRDKNSSSKLEKKSHSNRPQRSFEELSRILKGLIRDQYKQIEDLFQKLDVSSYGELTKDLLFKLFQRLSLDPPIDRNEIDLIFSRCHLKENGNLEFYQFLREFAYSKGSAHYPNAKQNPPQRGDADFLLTSRKLYGDSVLVQGTALNSIRSNWNQLKSHFRRFDPFQTGFVQSEEFDEILLKFCPIINDEDLQIIKEKYRSKDQTRINYMRFLKRHLPIEQINDQLNSNGKNPFSDKTDRNSSNRIDFSRKLIEKEKSLKRLFKENDRTNSGFISLEKFREILHQLQIDFTDEHFRSFISPIDRNRQGNISYHRFIEEYLHNN